MRIRSWRTRAQTLARAHRRTPGRPRPRAARPGRLAAWLAAGLAAALACAPAGPASRAAAQARPDAGVVSTARPDAPVPPPTPQEARDARQLALAGQVYALVGAPAREGDMRTLTTTLEVQIAAALSDKDRVRARAIVDAVDDAIADIEPQVAQTAVKAMAQDFTAEQLQDMLSFYQSPSGRAALEKLPLITRQSLTTALNVLPELMAGVEGDFCAKVRCSAKDHEAFAAAAARLAAARPGPRPTAG